MKEFSYCLLRLHNRANSVIEETKASTQEEAAIIFRNITELPLDEHGYFKDGEITYCIAENYSNRMI